MSDERLVVVDCETTGTGDDDEAVEVAAIQFDSGDALTSLINPQRSIPAAARAIHHIRDEDVANAPTMDEFAAPLRAFVGSAIVVAHNATFDWRYIRPLRGHRWLCTMRLARHLLPELDSYSNQFLFEHFGARRSGESLRAHRAYADALVTREVLRCLLVEARAKLGNRSVGQLADMASQPYLVARMPFGKYRGLPLEDVPKGYVSWCLREIDDLDDDLRNSLEAQLRAA